ncbi:MAG: M1 family metallopeptidase [Chloroflexota bacterium]
MAKRSLFILMCIFSLTMGITSAQDAQPGADGVGDKLYPLSGNGGYDVQQYDLQLKWNNQTGTIDAQTTIKSIATQDLSAFNLDFIGFDITKLTVDGKDAKFSRKDSELTVDAAVTKGKTFETVVAYNGNPSQVKDSLTTGWIAVKDSVIVISEPVGAQGWFPSNDHPSDKALFTYEVTVPKAYQVAANGLPDKPVENGDNTTYKFAINKPMATYLATINIGKFKTVEQTGPDGLPIVNYFPPDFTDPEKAFTRQPEILSFLSEKFGPYPFDVSGGIVVNQQIGVALEAQTRPIYGTDASELVVAHELSHQWFGDNVSVATWDQIWLNEGFATFAELLWIEHINGKNALDHTIQRRYDELQGLYRFSKDDLISSLESGQLPDVQLTPEKVGQLLHLLMDSAATKADIDAVVAKLPKDGAKVSQLGALMRSIPVQGQIVLKTIDFYKFNSIITGEPLAADAEQKTAPNLHGPADVESGDMMFDGSVYQRGGLALQALRLKLGDDTFFKLLQTYVSQYAGKNVTTTEFTSLAEKISGQDLKDFFQRWLYDKPLPPITELGLS